MLNISDACLPSFSSVEAFGGETGGGGDGGSSTDDIIELVTISVSIVVVFAFVGSLV